MDAERPTAAALAKGALRRLARARQEPTPANFARAYADEAGEALHAEGLPSPPRALDQGATAAATQGSAWALLIERIVRGLERGARHWTGARKKDSLQRVLDGSRSDGQRLQQRLQQLLTAWEADQPDAAVDPALAGEAGGVAAAPLAAPAAIAPAGAWPREPGLVIVAELHNTVRAALPTGEPRARELADELAALAARIASEGATVPLAGAVSEVCHRVCRLLGLRHELVDELLALCRSLTEGMTELAEDGSWAQGQSGSLRQRLDGVTGARAVRAARELLEGGRETQRTLQQERARAREALRQALHQLLAELGSLGDATGRFNDKVKVCGQAIESADSLESLAEAVREMLDESRTVHELVAGARERLASGHDRALALESRVLGLEAELRRLSDEVSTDALTQVANRRGLAQAFEQESARVGRAGAGSAPLAVGLIDIDNFKKLNDNLGHAAGDLALQRLAARVKEWLRPVDHVARFGGEEFALLLPGTPVAEAQQVLTRLQRRLSASLFMHEGREVFVTFSAGVTAWRPGETVDAALARADEGLYEAKRSGRNRSCIA